MTGSGAVDAEDFRASIANELRRRAARIHGASAWNDVPGGIEVRVVPRWALALRTAFFLACAAMFAWTAALSLQPVRPGSGPWGQDWVAPLAMSLGCVGFTAFAWLDARSTMRRRVVFTRGKVQWSAGRHDIEGEFPGAIVTVEHDRRRRYEIRARWHVLAGIAPDEMRRVATYWRQATAVQARDRIASALGVNEA